MTNIKSDVFLGTFYVCDEGIKPGDAFFVRAETGQDGIHKLSFVD